MEKDLYYIQLYDKKSGQIYKNNILGPFNSLISAQRKLSTLDINTIGAIYTNKLLPPQNINNSDGSGKVALCRNCNNTFIASKKHKYICKICADILYQDKTCPICGKVFNSKYQNNTCCSQSCAKKLNNNFKNSEILEKIKNTNIQKYGVANPWNSKAIQQKCIANRNEEQKSKTLKQVNAEKYKESRRLKNLKRNKSASHCEAVIFDTLINSQNMFINHAVQGKTFDDCVFKQKLRFDFYIPYIEGENNSQCLIEYDGAQHIKPIRFNKCTDSQMYKNFISCQVKDWYKDFYCIQNNIPLIRIKNVNKQNPSFDDIYKNHYIVGKAQASDQLFQCFDIIDADFVNNGNYPTFVIESGITCTFKCDKENGSQLCHNFALCKSKPITLCIDDIINRYMSQNLAKAITLQGLEPLDTLKQQLWLIYHFRQVSDDYIYIWTGYTEEECEDLIYLIKNKMNWKNIIIKFGRFRPNQKRHFDELLGIDLISDNQYAKKIS